MSQVNASIRKHTERQQQATTPAASDTSATAEATKEWTKGEKAIVGTAIGIVALSVGVVIFSILTMDA